MNPERLGSILRRMMPREDQAPLNPTPTLGEFDRMSAEQIRDRLVAYVKGRIISTTTAMIYVNLMFKRHMLDGDGHEIVTSGIRGR